MGEAFSEENGKAYSETKKPSPEVGAEGSWLVVLAGFVMHFFVSGISSVFGLLYIELERETGSDILTLSWIGSLFVGFSLDSGILYTCVFIHAFLCKACIRIISL